MFQGTPSRANQHRAALPDVIQPNLDFLRMKHQVPQFMTSVPPFPLDFLTSNNVSTEKVNFEKSKINFEKSAKVNCEKSTKVNTEKSNVNSDTSKVNAEKSTYKSQIARLLTPQIAQMEQKIESLVRENSQISSVISSGRENVAISSTRLPKPTKRLDATRKVDGKVLQRSKVSKDENICDWESLAALLPAEVVIACGGNVHMIKVRLLTYIIIFR